MTHVILATIAGTLVGDFLLVAWLAYRASLPPKIQPPAPPAKAAVFHIHPTMIRPTPQGFKLCIRVEGPTTDEIIEGLLLAAHGVES